MFICSKQFGNRRNWSDALDGALINYYFDNPEKEGAWINKAIINFHLCENEINQYFLS